MLRGMSVAWFLLIAAASSWGKAPPFQLRVYAQANAHDGEVFAAKAIAPISGEEMFVEKVPAISERDVIGAATYPARDGTFGVMFNLDAHGRAALETLSVENRGRKLLVMVNGRLLTEMAIDRRVSDGRFYIPSGLSAAEIELLRKSWPAPRSKS